MATESILVQIRAFSHHSNSLLWCFVKIEFYRFLLLHSWFRIAFLGWLRCVFSHFLKHLYVTLSVTWLSSGRQPNLYLWWQHILATSLCFTRCLYILNLFKLVLHMSVSSAGKYLILNFRLFLIVLFIVTIQERSFVLRRDRRPSLVELGPLGSFSDTVHHIGIYRLNEGVLHFGNLTLANEIVLSAFRCVVILLGSLCYLVLILRVHM